MRNTAYLLILQLLVTVPGAFSQNSLQAVSINIPPKLDGNLDDATWKNVPVASGFVTNSPIYGKPSMVKTEVKVVYDNLAIYVGAYLYDDPSKIGKQMTLRDGEQRQNIDFFAIFFDTYLDRQSGFEFLVTSQNVQTDARLSPSFPANNYGTYGDLSWDAVWDSRVAMHNDGWSVEIKIPYSAIRFSKKNMQNWGIQLLRFVRRENEISFWNPVDPNVNGFVNQFGTLTGLEKLVPPLRLSFSPYLSSGFRSNPQADGSYTREWLKSGGMDVKYGISESFTLDATLIPDFGQVISDNLVNNITPFEVRFTENRPFFTEGTELFNKAGIFYSRRIGATPSGYYSTLAEADGGSLKDYDIIKNPTVTRLYNAIKFSGRTKGKLGIGLFNAITEPVHAKLRNRISGRDTILTTEPLTNYNIFVLDQALKDRSYITLTNTNVMRNGNARDANVTAVNFAWYDSQNKYGFFLRPKYSKVYGNNGYDGYANFLQFAKVSGTIQYSFSNTLQSAKYDPNDLGILQAPNQFINQANFSYNIYKESKHFLNQRYSVGMIQSYLYQPFSYQKTSLNFSAFGIFHNFWDMTVNFEVAPRWYNDYFELQTPKDVRATPRVKMKRSPYYFLGIEGSSDSRKRLFMRWEFGGAEGPLPHDPFNLAHLGWRYRFSDRLSIDLDVQRQHDEGQFGFAFIRDNSTGAPIIARRKYTDVTSIVTGTYNFTPRMNLSLRARHFWNKLHNTQLFNVKADGYYDERFDLDPSNYNINYNTFSLDVFYTWDFRLGSKIIIGYKNWLGRDFEYLVDGFRYGKYFNNLGQVFDQSHGNELTIRFIYYLDYLQLKGKKR